MLASLKKTPSDASGRVSLGNTVELYSQTSPQGDERHSKVENESGSMIWKEAVVHQTR